MRARTRPLLILRFAESARKRILFATAGGFPPSGCAGFLLRLLPCSDLPFDNLAHLLALGLAGLPEPVGVGSIWSGVASATFSPW